MQDVSKKLLHTLTPLAKPIRLPFLISCKADDVEGWVQRLGPTGEPDTFAGSKPSLMVTAASVTSPVRVLRPKELTTTAIKENLSESDWNFWLGVGSIETAYRKGDLMAVRMAYARVMPFFYPHLRQFKSIEPQPAQEEMSIASAAVWISGVVTQAFDEARIVCWQVGKDFERTPPVFAEGLYCPDYKTALAMQLIFSRRVKICPRCHDSFEGPPNKTYCSKTCRSSYGVARWRREKKR
jgi:hypothetical protein